MGRYGLIQTLFLLSLVCFPTPSGVCGASNITQNSAASPPQGSSPLSPTLDVPKLDYKNETSKTSNDETKEPQATSKSSNVSTEKTNPDISVSPPPSVAKPDKKTENDTKNVDKKANPKPSQDGRIKENCDGKQNLCPKNSSIKVCLNGSDAGSKGLAVLVQNVGGNALEVNIALHSSTKDEKRALKLDKHQIEKIEVPGGQGTRVTVHAGSNECVFRIRSPVMSKWDVLFHRPTFNQLATPVNGAYLFIITVVIFGVTWACCKFTRRWRRDGVAYQELEMGSSEIPSATNVESTEGWDEGWDDDWDEETAVKSAGRPGMGNISANGLTSRAANRDGWENDWDN